MKKLFGIILIVVGFFALSKYPNLGKNSFETLGALLGVGLFTFLPAYFLMRESKK